MPSSAPRSPTAGPRAFARLALLALVPFLAACGHAVSAGIGRLYIAGHASYAYADLFPVG